MFCRMKLTPTAVISGANFGALRSRRYASFSMVDVEQRAQRHDDAASTTASSNHAFGDDFVWPSRSSRKIAASTEPIMNRSPWAKLISSMMP